MKKYINLHNAGRIIVFFEILLCAVATLSVLMVNGADSFSTDHLALILLIAITIASVFLRKGSNLQQQKMVLWMAVLPLLFVSYEAIAAFMLPYHA